MREQMWHQVSVVSRRCENRCEVFLISVPAVGHEPGALCVWAGVYVAPVLDLSPAHWSGWKNISWKHYFLLASILLKTPLTFPPKSHCFSELGLMRVFLSQFVHRFMDKTDIKIYIKLNAPKDNLMRTRLSEGEIITVWSAFRKRYVHSEPVIILLRGFICPSFIFCSPGERISQCLAWFILNSDIEPVRHMTGQASLWPLLRGLSWLLSSVFK